MDKIYEELERLRKTWMQLEVELNKEFEDLYKGNAKDFWAKNEEFVAAHKKWLDYLHKNASDILLKRNKN
jgi:hypothetical protein